MYSSLFSSVTLMSASVTLTFPTPSLYRVILLDVLFLVFVGDLDVGSAFLKVVRLHFSENFKVGGEEEFQTTLLYVVLPEKLRCLEYFISLDILI